MVHEIVSQNGLVIYQTSEDRDGLKYLLYDREMYVKGGFEKVSGYVNGPAWFKTRTARELSGSGMRFSVGRRK